MKISNVFPYKFTFFVLLEGNNFPLAHFKPPCLSTQARFFPKHIDVGAVSRCSIQFGCYISYLATIFDAETQIQQPFYVYRFILHRGWYISFKSSLNTDAAKYYGFICSDRHIIWFVDRIIDSIFINFTDSDSWSGFGFAEFGFEFGIGFIFWKSWFGFDLGSVFCKIVIRIQIRILYIPKSWFDSESYSLKTDHIESQDTYNLHKYSEKKKYTWFGFDQNVVIYTKLQLHIKKVICIF